MLHTKLQLNISRSKVIFAMFSNGGGVKLFLLCLVMVAISDYILNFTILVRLNINYDNHECKVVRIIMTLQTDNK